MKHEEKNPTTLKLTALVMGGSDRVMYGLGPEGEIVRISDPMSAGPMSFSLIHDPAACEATQREKAAKEAEKNVKKNRDQVAADKAGDQGETQAAAKQVEARAKAANPKKEKPKEATKAS